MHASSCFVLYLLLPYRPSPYLLLRSNSNSHAASVYPLDFGTRPSHLHSPPSKPPLALCPPAPF